MNWYKFSQFTEENTQNIDVPLITVQPYEPVVQEAVDELYNENPRFFVGVNKINIDMGFGQFGSVESLNPADININMNKIKSEVAMQAGQIDENNPESRQALKEAIKRTIIHEKAHVQDASGAQFQSENQLSGQELFPGGESSAQRAETQYFG